VEKIENTVTGCRELKRRKRRPKNDASCDDVGGWTLDLDGRGQQVILNSQSVGLLNGTLPRRWME